jgi:hypothetical protein
MIKAIVYSPAGQLDHGARCAVLCERLGYEIDGITSDLRAALTMLADEVVDALVVDTESDLNQEQRPRIVVVAGQPTPQGGRRSRIIRRNAAE